MSFYTQRPMDDTAMDDIRDQLVRRQEAMRAQVPDDTIDSIWKPSRRLQLGDVLRDEAEQQYRTISATRST